MRSAFVFINWVIEIKPGKYTQDQIIKDPFCAEELDFNPSTPKKQAYLQHLAYCFMRFLNQLTSNPLAAIPKPLGCGVISRNMPWPFDYYVGRMVEEIREKMLRAKRSDGRRWGESRWESMRTWGTAALGSRGTPRQHTGLGIWAMEGLLPTVFCPAFAWGSCCSELPRVEPKPLTFLDIAHSHAPSVTQSVLKTNTTLFSQQPVREVLLWLPHHRWKSWGTKGSCSW